MAQTSENAIQEVWSLFRKTDAIIDRLSNEVSRVSEEVSRVSEEVSKVSKNVGDLTGKWGKFVEGLVAPGAVKLFNERGIEVERTSTRNRVRKGGEEMEIDVLIENEECAVVIEVKSTLKVEDVNELIEKLKRFREFFPRYEDSKLIGAVAGIVIEERADRYAYRQGLFVIGQTGETVKILNDDKFKPKVW